MRANGETSGFTLIELLVVIAIIAILASMLLPVLGKAKARADGVNCMSQLKQLQICYTMYADDNNDLLVHNYATSTASIGDSWVLGNPKVDVSTTNIENGLLFKYNKSVKIYRCPADTAMTTATPTMGNPNPVGVPRNRSYSMFYLLGADPATTPAAITKMSAIVNPPPSRESVFWEEDARSMDNGAIGIYGTSTGTWDWWNLPSSYHSRGCELSFADGHAELWKWRGTSVLALGQPAPPAGVGMHAPCPVNDPDMIRVQATVPP
jgi:prepilin-type N-terminal cleavage/methylation domain-containing protein